MLGETHDTGSDMFGRVGTATVFSNEQTQAWSDNVYRTAPCVYDGGTDLNQTGTTRYGLNYQSVRGCAPFSIYTR
jgi:hypothetical protein